jgi:hypothetical protein
MHGVVTILARTTMVGIMVALAVVETSVNFLLATAVKYRFKEELGKSLGGSGRRDNCPSEGSRNQPPWEKVKWERERREGCERDRDKRQYRRCLKNIKHERHVKAQNPT